MGSEDMRSAKLYEALQNDFKNLCMETKKKYPHIKDSSEEAIIKIRGAAMNPQTSSLALISSQILYPLVQASETKDHKIVKLSLSLVQRLIVSGSIIDQGSADSIVEMLWMLMEIGIEELKVLQTTTLLVTTNSVIQNTNLAKCLVLCFRLHFTKDAIVINTASATVRQLVNAIFERVIAEDSLTPPADRKTSESKINLEDLKELRSTAPKSLRPAASDAFLMFQDLVQLVNADQPLWLVGLTEMTRTFGLELLESVLVLFPNIFYQHAEFTFLLKDRVCALVIKLFSPNLKYRASGPSSFQQSTPVDRPYFPITMRLLRVVSILIQKYYPLLITQCEIFLSLIVKFLEADRPMWQRCLALEVLHKIVVQPNLLVSFCTNYDMKPHSTKIFQDMVNSLGSFVQSFFVQQSVNQTLNAANQTSSIPMGLPVSGGVSQQPAFFLKGVYQPLCFNYPRSYTKSTYLEMLDKLDPPTIIDGYGISVSYFCLLDITHSIHTAIIGNSNSKGLMENFKEYDAKVRKEDQPVHEQLLNSSWSGLLNALVLLLESSTDETVTESILESFQKLSSLAGKLNLKGPRDSFIIAICKSCLPSYYNLSVLNDSTVNQGSTMSKNHQNKTPIAAGQQHFYESEMRHQVVAVGTALATSSLPVGAQQGPVMLTNKNLQCMRAILTLSQTYGCILASAWHLVLTTLQHLVWILGLKPTTGGTLKASRSSSETNAVITTAVIADLPVLSSMLSTLFESSQELDEVALHHLIDALCQLSRESMELAFNNREPSLFAVAKLLETGVVNLGRVEVLWRPISNHLLEVCQHPHVRMREWGVEAVTYLIKTALAYHHSLPLKENQKLQTLLLSPLSELSSIGHSDVRQKQLESLLHILHSCGEILHHGWPLIINIIGAINDNHSEHLVRLAFQCLQLVVTDFLPLMPWACLPLTVDSSAKFGSQFQELNISLTAIGLMWNISDYFYQNQEKLRMSLVSDSQVFPDFPGVPNMPPFDKLWMCLYARLGDLCVDSRPAVRKSAGQTLFSTIAAHGALLHNETWQAVLWQVLFPLLDRVRQLSDTASTDKVDQGGNILIHHSRNTQQKQWAETQVLTLSGVARVFSTKQKILMELGDYPRAWALLLDFVHTASLSRSNEVSLAALKSFQEVIQSGHCNSTCSSLSSSPSSRSIDISIKAELPSCSDDNIANWSTAWKIWHSIGIEMTRAPPDHVTRGSDAFIPSQPFLTALVHIFPHLFHHIKTRFTHQDLEQLSQVFTGCLAVPVYGEASLFTLSAFNDVVVTPLQEGVLQCLTTIQKEITDGSQLSQSMVPKLYDLMLKFFSFSCETPVYGNIKTRPRNSKGVNQTDWVTMNNIPFAERCLSYVVNLYAASSSWPEVIQAKILKKIVQTVSPSLQSKYNCSSQTTWKLAITALLTVLQEGLQLAREPKNRDPFEDMWPDLTNTLDVFLFSSSSIPTNYSTEDLERDETIDCQVIELIRDEILPYAEATPSDFIVSVMVLLNKGSIHSSYGVNSDSERFQMREEFAKMCFETLLQFSLLNSEELLSVKNVCNNKGEEPSNVITSKLAVTSLLHRFKEVLNKYTDDTKLSGKCPLPRHRLAEISFVLHAIATLIDSLKKAKEGKVDRMTWKQLIDLYPQLVEVGSISGASSPPLLWKALRHVLLQYTDLLQPPSPGFFKSKEEEQQ